MVGSCYLFRGAGGFMADGCTKEWHCAPLWARHENIKTCMHLDFDAAITSCIVIIMSCNNSNQICRYDTKDK